MLKYLLTPGPPSTFDMYSVSMFCSTRDSGRVDFLYKDRADPEDYLLGKRVDTRFEQENIPTKS